MHSKQGIKVSVLGDYGPFSRIGKSIGYQVTVGSSSFLVDCGSPVFQRIGGHGLKEIKGLIITHCHDDHKRWFTDFALFNRYAPDIGRKVRLYTSDEVNQGLMESSEAALGSSLSPDSSRIIDIAYNDYVAFHSIAPRPKYRIISQELDDGLYCFMVVDREGNEVEPERAKIFISPKRKAPRLLFRDPETGDWVEPASYYPFSSEIFYEKAEPYRDPEGFTIEAINAPVWHGVPSIGIRISTGDEAVVFSSDTNHNLELWQRLYLERHYCDGRHEGDVFAEARVIHGDINDYIERVWSEERYHDAVNSFKGAVVFHDIALRKSVVHTDYRDLDKTVLDRPRTILTHGPDKITSAWVLCEAEKQYLIRGTAVAEVVGDEEYPFVADFYHKEEGRYYACFKSESGSHAIYERDGILFLSSNPYRGSSRLVCTVEIYEDIGGEYFPLLEEKNSFYRRRPDGRVEKITMGENDSRGEIACNHRPRLPKRQSPACRSEGCSPAATFCHQ